MALVALAVFVCLCVYVHVCFMSSMLTVFVLRGGQKLRALDRPTDSA